MIAASCSGCGKQYRVPAAGRTYPCKSCGGEVRALLEDPVEAEESELACPGCGASAAVDQAFCEACGAALGGAGAAGGTRRARRTAGARAELSLARGELERAKRAMRFVRALYLLGMVVAAVAVGSLTFGLLYFEVTGRMPIVLLVVFGMELALYAVGYKRAYREPLLWSVLIASYRTVSLFITLLSADSVALSTGLSIGMLVSVVWTVLLWLAVVRVARVRTVIEEQPEAWDALGELRRRGAGKNLDPASLGRRSRQVVTERRRSRRALLIVGAVTIAVLFVGWGAYALATRSPAFEPTLEEFTRSWNASEVDAVAGHFAEERRDSVRRWLTRSTSTRDWSAGLPELAEVHVSQTSSTRRVVRLEAQDGSIVRVSWRVEGGRWVATSAQAGP